MCVVYVCMNKCHTPYIRVLHRLYWVHTCVVQCTVSCFVLFNKYYVENCCFTYKVKYQIS